MNWYIEALKKYAVFSGRSRRKEYWYFALFNLIITIVLTLIDSSIGTLDSNSGYGVLNTIYSLGVLLPGLGVSIRRLHDIGRSGWWLLIGFIPLVGAIVLIIFFVKDSQPGENQYGPSPKSEQQFGEQQFGG